WSQASDRARPTSGSSAGTSCSSSTGNCRPTRSARSSTRASSSTRSRGARSSASLRSPCAARGFAVSRRSPRCRIFTRSTSARPGTLEHFLAERYLLFSRAFGRKLFRLQVHHPPWPLRRVEGLEVAQTLSTADGVPPLRGSPLSQYSEGVDVDFFPPTLV